MLVDDSAAIYIGTNYQKVNALGTNFAAAATTAINGHAKFLEVDERDRTDAGNQAAITTAHNGLSVS